MTTDGANYCMLVNKWVWSKSSVCLQTLEVDMGSVLESELWRYGILKACIC